ncbi:MAG: type VII toxin-antitoxin system HepT family RNase toxin [Planctomycetota bacterium]|jgi:uncharacterized protein YutE (UPF0331/DUF86 family)
MVNEEIVRRLINNIESYVKDLESHSEIPYSEYSTDIKTQRFIERTLHIAIEAMLDIAHHIISDECLREPDSYTDAFKILAENNIIPSAYLDKAKLMAQFRNKLVHNYEKIDQEQLFSIFKDHQNDFIEFVELISRWLKTSTN